jgi:hypothetical protein
MFIKSYLHHGRLVLVLMGGCMGAGSQVFLSIFLLFANLSWHLYHSVIISPLPDWLRHTKGNMSAFTCLLLFAKHLSDYSDYTAIYTDRSLLHSLTGCAFIYEGQVFSYHLCSFNSVFTTEPLCHVLSSPVYSSPAWQCHLLCADSLSSLRGSHSCRHNRPGTVETVTNLRHM